MRRAIRLHAQHAPCGMRSAHREPHCHHETTNQSSHTLPGCSCHKVLPNHVPQDANPHGSVSQSPGTQETATKNHPITEPSYAVLSPETGRTDRTHVPTTRQATQATREPHSRVRPGAPNPKGPLTHTKPVATATQASPSLRILGSSLNASSCRLPHVAVRGGWFGTSSPCPL